MANTCICDVFLSHSVNLILLMSSTSVYLCTKCGDKTVIQEEQGDNNNNYNERHMLR